MRVLGQHILVEFYYCNAEVLNSQDLIQHHMEAAAVKSNATIVQSVFHRFNPHGVSGVVVIAESHLAIHTWPEYNYAAVDLFTCGPSVNPWVAFEILKEGLGAAQFTSKELRRGLPDTADSADVQIQHKPMAAV
ncbi:adenosylmethionine decarboxylase [Thermodesulfobacteriota bacterium]